MARLKVDDIVGQKFTMKSGRELVVLNYEFKEKNNHLYKCKFSDTGNEYTFNRNQIIKLTARDMIREKQLKTISNKNKLIERNRLIKKGKESYSYPNLRDKVILGVDLATKSTGICFYKDSEYRTKVISSNHDCFRKRGHDIVKQIVDILKKTKIDAVITEQTFLGLNSGILAMLSEIRGMLTYHIQDLGIELHLVPPNLWKAHFNLSVTRFESKEESKKLFEVHFKRAAETDDESDAFLITKFAVEKGEM